MEGYLGQGHRSRSRGQKMCIGTFHSFLRACQRRNSGIQLVGILRGVFSKHMWFLSPPVHIAQWAHMHRFPSVCPSVRLSICHWIIIHISESIIAMNLIKNPTWVLNLRFATLHVYLAPSQFCLERQISKPSITKPQVCLPSQVMYKMLDICPDNC